jgi:hypothetical protein
VNFGSTSRNRQAPAAAVVVGLLLGSGTIPAWADETDTDEVRISHHSGRVYLGDWDLRISPPGGGQNLLAPQWPSGQQASAFALSQPIGMGLNVDAGVYQYRGDQTRDSGHNAYFFGVSYSELDGGVWYTNGDALDGPRGRIEAGWTHAIADELTVSLRMGHTDYSSNRRFPASSSLSIGAQRRLGHVGFGLGVVDRGLLDAPQGDRFHLFGKVSAAFP